MILQIKFIRSEQNYEAESITLKRVSLKHCMQIHFFKARIFQFAK